MYTRFVSLIGVLLISASSFAGQPGNDALKKLMRALASQRDVEATLIQVRSMDGAKITVRTQNIPGRGMRATALKPTYYSGIVSFDDGVKYRLYDPVRQLVIEESSPERYKFDISFRKGLIEKNYALRFEKDETVAQRTTKVVFMEGLKSGVADRRLFIDASSDLILRYVVYRKGAVPDVRIDTLQVELWVTAGPDFTKVAPPDAIKSYPKAPIEFDPASKALNYVDFEPVIPSSLPAGLEKQAMHIVHHKDLKFVAVRLTDGMAFVTVYLYSNKYKDRNGVLRTLNQSELPLGGESYAKAKDGLRCWIIGDADEGLKERLAKLFIRAYDRTID